MQDWRDTLDVQVLATNELLQKALGSSSQPISVFLRVFFFPTGQQGSLAFARPDTGRRENDLA